MRRDPDLPPSRLIRDFHRIVRRRAGLVVEHARIGDAELGEEVRVDRLCVVGLEELRRGAVVAAPGGEDVAHPGAAAVGHYDGGCEGAAREEGKVEVADGVEGVGEGGVFGDEGDDVGEEEAEGGYAGEVWKERSGGCVESKGIGKYHCSQRRDA